MPFPIGHTAIGLAVYETVQPPDVHSSNMARIFFITLMANLPDLDVLYGLAVQGNGAAFHRGPTHSLLFALAAGCVASHLWRLWRYIPKLSFGLCSMLIFSHVAADMLLTNAPVSLLWPFEIHWSQGHSSWGQVFDMVLFQGIRDAGIVLVALGYVFALKFMRSNPTQIREPAMGIYFCASPKKRAK